MQTFTDAVGRNWTINLTLGSAMRVRDKLGVDLLQPELGNPPLLDRLGSDEILLGEILCALLESQMTVYNVTTDDVYASFDGATLFAGTEAFFKEMIDFFLRRGRKDRAKAVEKQRAVIKAGIALAESRIDRIDENRQIETMAARADQILGDFYGSSEENSGSTSEITLSDS